MADGARCRGAWGDALGCRKWLSEFVPAEQIKPAKTATNPKGAGRPKGSGEAAPMQKYRERRNSAQRRRETTAHLPQTSWRPRLSAWLTSETANLPLSKNSPASCWRFEWTVPVSIYFPKTWSHKAAFGAWHQPTCSISYRFNARGFRDGQRRLTCGSTSGNGRRCPGRLGAGFIFPTQFVSGNRRGLSRYDHCCSGSQHYYDFASVQQPWTFQAFPLS